MPRALDFFCGGGGATRGLQRAGFKVTGVDINRQPRYCGEEFIQASALDWAFSVEYLRNFDLVWASPPCQRYSTGAAKWGTSANHPHLIPAVRDRLIAAHVPYVIENIVQAKPHLREPIMLCGVMFDLGVFRHRLFELSGFGVRQCKECLYVFPAVTGRYGCPNCNGDGIQHVHPGRIGDGKYHTVTGHSGGSSKRDGWKNGGVAQWQKAMEIDWMTGPEMAEAIPPAYSEFIARKLIERI